MIMCVVYSGHRGWFPTSLGRNVTLLGLVTVRPSSYMNSTWPPPLPRRSTRRSLRSPAFLPPASHLPGRSSAPPSFAGRSASTHYARRASPFVRLETAVLGRLSTSRKEPQLRQEDVDLTLPPALALTDAGSEADTNSYRPSFASARRSMASSFASPRSTEYCCAICIELLLRPVVLSCGHRLCRGCWVRLLQGSQARAVASRTGYAVCPLGRCQVRPCVPEIDLDLAAEMRKRIGFKQLAAHAAAAEDVSLAEESAAVAAVNAWAAAGCPLDAPEEIEADEQELAAAVAAAAAATLAVESLEREERKSLCASLLIVFTLASACATFGLFIWGWHQKIGVRGLPSSPPTRKTPAARAPCLICSSYLQPELSRL